MIALGRCAANTLLAATGERTRKPLVTVKERKTDVQLNQGKTILVMNMGEGRASSINGRQQT